MGIRSVLRRKFKATTDSKHNLQVAKNLLNREFKVQELGKVWVSDITYIRVNSSWMYLTTMIDLADRKVVGWSLSQTMTVEDTVLKAWTQARNTRTIADDFILHSDRGIQYACNKTQNLFTYNKKTTQSMSRKGNCWDNAVAESFFKTIKYEMIYRCRFTSKEQLNQAIDQYIIWYNTQRIHSSLDYKTPLEKERELKNLDYKKVA